MKTLSLLLLSVSLGLAQTTVTLNGSAYTLKSHPRVWLNGASGSLTTAFSDVTNRAQTANPAYSVLSSATSSNVSQNICTTGLNTFSGAICKGAMMYQQNEGSFGAMAAMVWFANGANPADPILPYAMQLVLNPEEITYGSFTCDLTADYCGRYAFSIFDAFTDDINWAAYSILWGQMTSGQRTTLAAMMMNDNDIAHNGFSTVACTPITYNIAPAGTVTTNGNQLIGVGTNFTSLSPGQIIFGPEGQNTMGYIFSIQDATHLLLTTPAVQAYAGSAYTYANPWTTGNCGMVWFLKHHHDAPFLQPSQSSHYTADYPTNGGVDSVLVGIQNQSQGNIQGGFLRWFIQLGLALADVSTDAQTMLTLAYQQYHDYSLPLFEAGLTPFNAGAGNGYASLWMQNYVYPLLALQQSVISGPGFAPNSLKSMLNYPQFVVNPTTNPNGFETTGWATGDGGCAQFACFIAPIFMASYMKDGSNETKQYYGYMRSRSDYSAAGWAGAGRFYSADIYPFYNFNEAGLATPTTQYAFIDADLTNAQCASTYSLGCLPNMIWQYAISKTGFGTSDTMLLMKGGWYSQGQDHTNCVQYGSFHIYRQQFLLGGDGPGAGVMGEGCMLGGVFGESMIDLNQTTLTAPTYGSNQYAPFIRWGGGDPYGDSSSRYAYAMEDMTNTYASGGNASRVQRQWIHFKKSGAQDYIVTYDDIALSGAIAVAPKSYFHYVLQGVAPATAIAYSGTTKTVNNTQTALGAVLNSSFISTAGATTSALVVDNANGTYTSGNGNSFRAYMCPSSNGSTCDATKTTGEWIGIFQPINATTGTMPTITQITPSTGVARVAQIADGTTPKVASFSTGGSTITALSFTSTHSGTAQYLIAGLTPGVYTATVGGSAVTGSPFTVVANDNTLYFESTAGLVSILASGGAANGTTTKNTVNKNMVKN